MRKKEKKKAGLALTAVNALAHSKEIGKKWAKRKKRAEAAAGAAVRLINAIDDHRNGIFRG